MLLQLEGITRSFGGLVAVGGVDLTLAQGEILGLIGPNGSGKTTLFNLITGFLKPNRGRVIFQGEDITRLPLHSICRRGIARTFQLVRPFAHLTALENAKVAALYGHRPTADRVAAEQRALAALAFVGLEQRRDQRAGALILAERKRLELARALAAEPTLLLVDEIMAGLTPTETERAMELLRRIREQGVTIIMIEHIMQAVLGLCDRLVVLNAGRKIAEGLPRAVAADPGVIEAYLGEKIDA